MNTNNSLSNRAAASDRLTLVLLAAGVGSRYGGMKQLDSFGPNGETIMDYSIFDARRAGFKEAILVIRPDMETVFRESLARRISPHIPLRFVHQKLDALPAGYTVPTGRTKPWGTGQAVLAAAGAVEGPFAVANADDLYGPSAMAALAEFLGQPRPDSPSTYTMVSYRLRDTLSEKGTVSRGVCRCTGDGWLESIVETTKIATGPDGGLATNPDGTQQSIPGETPVSMNLWGFQGTFFNVLQNGFARFLEQHGQTTDREYYLPVAVQEAMRDLGARVKVLASRDAWHGVTHREDRTPVENAIRGLIARGVYPQRLWE